MAALLTGLVSSTLYAQRTRQASLSAEKLAASAAPFFAQADLEGLDEMLHAAAADEGGRILLIDKEGKIQYDTLSLLEGTRTQAPEAIAVLTRLQGVFQRAPLRRPVRRPHGERGGPHRRGAALHPGG